MSISADAECVWLVKARQWLDLQLQTHHIQRENWHVEADVVKQRGSVTRMALPPKRKLGSSETNVYMELPVSDESLLDKWRSTHSKSALDSYGQDMNSENKVNRPQLINPRNSEGSDTQHVS